MTGKGLWENENLRLGFRSGRTLELTVPTLDFSLLYSSDTVSGLPRQVGTVSHAWEGPELFISGPLEGDKIRFLSA